MVCFKLSLVSISSKYNRECVHINCSQSEAEPCKHGYYVRYFSYSLQWRHNGLDSVSNHQPHRCVLRRLFGRWSKKTSKLRVTGLCAGNSPGTGEFPTQRASNAENVSIWWRHHVLLNIPYLFMISRTIVKFWYWRCHHTECLSKQIWWVGKFSSTVHSVRLVFCQLGPAYWQQRLIVKRACLSNYIHG